MHMYGLFEDHSTPTSLSLLSTFATNLHHMFVCMNFFCVCESLRLTTTIRVTLGLEPLLHSGGLAERIQLEGVFPHLWNLLAVVEDRVLPSVPHPFWTNFW